MQSSHMSVQERKAVNSVLEMHWFCSRNLKLAGSTVMTYIPSPLTISYRDEGIGPAAEPILADKLEAMSRRSRV
ncbi:unnamed protein product [Urochloa humidicola]